MEPLGHYVNNDGLKGFYLKNNMSHLSVNPTFVVQMKLVVWPNLIERPLNQFLKRSCSKFKPLVPS